MNNSELTKFAVSACMCVSVGAPKVGARPFYSRPTRTTTRSLRPPRSFIVDFFYFFVLAGTLDLRSFGLSPWSFGLEKPHLATHTKRHNGTAAALTVSSIVCCRRTNGKSVVCSRNGVAQLALMAAARRVRQARVRSATTTTYIYYYTTTTAQPGDDPQRRCCFTAPTGSAGPGRPFLGRSLTRIKRTACL